MILATTSFAMSVKVNTMIAPNRGYGQGKGVAMRSDGGGDAQVEKRSEDEPHDRHAQSGKQRNSHSFYGKASKSAFYAESSMVLSVLLGFFCQTMGWEGEKCGGGRSYWGICQTRLFESFS